MHGVGISFHVPDWFLLYLEILKSIRLSAHILFACCLLTVGKSASVYFFTIASWRSLLSLTVCRLFRTASSVSANWHFRACFLNEHNTEQLTHLCFAAYSHIVKLSTGTVLVYHRCKIIVEFCNDHLIFVWFSDTWCRNIW